LDLLELSKPIFADIKASSEKRINNAEMFTRLSVDEQKAELEKDLAEYQQIFESNGHVPFPIDVYRTAGLDHIDATAGIADEAERTKAHITYFAKRGSDLYGRVSKLRRPIMANLAGVTYDEWSSYLDNENKTIPFPLSCTLPSVKESKAFRTKAATDLEAYGEAASDLIDQCDAPDLNTAEILDLLDQSRPIFEDIKRISEGRFDKIDAFFAVSPTERENMLNEDLSELEASYISHGHSPFPIANYKNEQEKFLASAYDKNAAIDFFIKRGKDLYKEVSNIRRPIMANLAGVTYEEWSSYLDNEKKEIPFPLSCTLPYVRESKTFRTEAAADLETYGNAFKN
jgi:hypothetical protein